MKTRKKLWVYHLMIISTLVAAISGCKKNNSLSTSSKPSLDAINRKSSFTTPTVPAPADSAGFTTLAFYDDFDSLSTIDINRTKVPGFKWYTDRAFGHAQVATATYTDTAGVLTITPLINTANLNICTYSPNGGTGQTFGHGYFEARMRFNPALGTASPGWPSFWSLSNRHLTTNNTDHWAELDFFEAYTGGNQVYPGEFLGSILDWADTSKIRYLNRNNYQANAGVDYSQWHTYGCLWTTGKVTWYFDGVAMMSQNFSATSAPSPLARGPVTPTPAGVFNIIDTETGGMTLILGSGVGWPMQVDWVHAWQN